MSLRTFGLFACLSLIVVAGVFFALLRIDLSIPAAFSQNLANASLAHALALPQDAPDRTTNLSIAQTWLDRIGQTDGLPRTPLARSRIALANGNADEAYRLLAGMTASDAMTDFLAGRAAWQGQHESAALKSWRRAGAETFFLLEAYRALDAHDWKKAEEDAAIAVGINPSKAEAHFAWADAASRAGALSPRIFDELALVLDLTEDSDLRSKALSRQGELMMRQGKLAEALIVFQEARAVAPGDPRPQTGYALVWLHSRPEARDEATQILEEVTRTSPWYTAAYTALADLAQANQDMRSAEEWLRKGLTTNKNDTRLLMPLADLLLRTGRKEEARAALILALGNDTHPDTLQEIVWRLKDIQ